MAGVTKELLVNLIQTLASGADEVADSFLNGACTIDEQNNHTIDKLKKAKLVRPSEIPGTVRLNADLKALLNRLVNQQSPVRQLTDMGRIIDEADTLAHAYKEAFRARQQSDSEYYFTALEDLLFDAVDEFMASIETMSYHLSSEFGFVASISAKVRENERALNRSHKLLKDLNSIDPSHMYSWIDEDCPNEFARILTRFIQWYQLVLGQLGMLAERMSQSLFKLRKQERQASLIKGMARHLREQSDFMLPEALPFLPELPATLKFAPPLQTGGWANVKQAPLQDEFAQIVAKLRAQPKEVVVQNRTSGDLELHEERSTEIDADWLVIEAEHYVNDAVLQSLKHGRLSALHYWHQHQARWAQQHQTQIDAELWLSVVFSFYCKLPVLQQQAFKIELNKQPLSVASNNYEFDNLTIYAVGQP